jgi:hypothetical protein
MALHSTNIIKTFDLSNKSSWKNLKFLKKLVKELKN